MTRNCHLTHLRLIHQGHAESALSRPVMTPWRPVKGYTIQRASCNLLFYFLNQRATWLKFLGRDKQAIFQMNDRASLPNNSIKRVRGTNGKSSELGNLPWSWIQFLKVPETSCTHHHDWSVRNTTEADRGRIGGLQKRKIGITISHFIKLELCFQGITRRGDYLTEKMHMVHSWPDWHWDAYDAGLHIYLQTQCNRMTPYFALICNYFPRTPKDPAAATGFILVTRL